MKKSDFIIPVSFDFKDCSPFYDEAFFDTMRKISKDCEYTKRNNEFGTGAIDRIIANDPATIIIWKNGDKTVVKCMEGDTYNVEQGIAMCILKYIFGTKYNDIKKLLQAEDTKLKEKQNETKENG